MSLLVTEITERSILGEPAIIFAADRRISVGNVPARNQQKVFRVPGLAAGIGFVGIAEVPSPRGKRPMAQWLRNFLDHTPRGESVNQLAARLARELNYVVPSHVVEHEPSAFQVAGFDGKGHPEFWYVRNLDDNRQPTLRRYEAREDFQSRNPTGLMPNCVAVYRNGDIRGHVLAWEKIEEGLGVLLAQPDFRRPRTPGQYAEWVAFKMEWIATAYEKYCRSSLIGRPIDSFAITSAQR